MHTYFHGIARSKGMKFLKAALWPSNPLILTALKDMGKWDFWDGLYHSSQEIKNKNGIEASKYIRNNIITHFKTQICVKIMFLMNYLNK